MVHDCNPRLHHAMVHDCNLRLHLAMLHNCNLRANLVTSAATVKRADSYCGRWRKKCFTRSVFMFCSIMGLDAAAIGREMELVFQRAVAQIEVQDMNTYLEQAYPALSEDERVEMLRQLKAGVPVKTEQIRAAMGLVRVPKKRTTRAERVVDERLLAELANLRRMLRVRNYSPATARSSSNGRCPRRPRKRWFSRPDAARCARMSARRAR